MNRLARAWSRLNIRIARTGPGAWFFSRVLIHLDRALVRVTGGRLSALRLFAGLEPCWVTTIGAKSGRELTVPLLATPDAGRYIVIASNFGRRNHPAWYYNLRAHPRVKARLRNQTLELVARLAEGEERERCWARGLENYVGYNDYAGRAGREIPVFIFEPAPA